MYEDGPVDGGAVLVSRGVLPELEIAGTVTRLLVDQIRSIDTAYIYIHGGPVHYLGRDELAEVEQAVSRYLGL